MTYIKVDGNYVEVTYDEFLEHYKILEHSYRPYDVVRRNKDGEICFIDEVSINTCQYSLEHILSYSITNLSSEGGSAWYTNEDLTFTGVNIFEAIAKLSCHPMGRSRFWVSKVMNGKRGKDENQS